MKKRKVGVIDILGRSASKTVFSRYSRANNMSIMPQVVAVWCEQAGHDVSFACYSGPELFVGEVPDDLDILFISAFTQNAILAYALSSYYRSKGIVTVIGGPHSRSYPYDSTKYFDYAVGFANKQTILDIVDECAPAEGIGQYKTASSQPTSLPGAEERWKYIMMLSDLAPIMKVIPILGSLGCPYTCSFCTDAMVPYQPLDFDALQYELRFIYDNKPKRSIVVWHDPNFGIRFDDYLGVIEEAVPPEGLSFIAETSLSLLKEDNCRRLGKAGFRAILPGIESWFDIGDKSRMRSVNGMEKVKRVAEHSRMITNYIPYMQANLILGLDADEGAEPFELTKQFVDLAPHVYPYFSLLTAYGRSAPANLQHQLESRVLNVPFHFLNQLSAMNVRPKNYTWSEMYAHICDVYAYSYSPRALARRFFGKIGAAGPHRRLTRFEMLLRGATSERKDKYRYFQMMQKKVEEPEFRKYLDGETTKVPAWYTDKVLADLQHFREWLPEGALQHDPNNYEKTMSFQPEQATAGMAVA